MWSVARCGARKPCEPSRSNRAVQRRAGVAHRCLVPCPCSLPFRLPAPPRNRYRKFLPRGPYVAGACTPAAAGQIWRHAPPGHDAQHQAQRPRHRNKCICLDAQRNSSRWLAPRSRKRYGGEPRTAAAECSGAVCVCPAQAGPSSKGLTAPGRCWTEAPGPSHSHLSLSSRPILPRTARGTRELFGRVFGAPAGPAERELLLHPRSLLRWIPKWKSKKMAAGAAGGGAGGAGAAESSLISVSATIIIISR